MSKDKFSLSEAIAMLSDLGDNYETGNYSQYGTTNFDNDIEASDINVTEDLTVDDDFNPQYFDSLQENIYINSESSTAQLTDAGYSGEMVELEIHVVDDDCDIEESESMPLAQPPVILSKEDTEALQTDQNNNYTLKPPSTDQMNSDAMNHQDGIQLNDDHTNSETETETPTHVVTEQSQKRGRRKIKDPSTWKKEIRKRRRQAGEEYIDSTGKLVHKKELKFTKDCNGKCRYKCAMHFSRANVKSIHNDFWSVSDNEKNTFYAATTEKCTKAETKAKGETSRRKFTYKYFFIKNDTVSSEKVRVCKEFYLSTLQISHRRIEYFYNKIQKNNGTCYDDMRGKATKQKAPQEDIDYIKSHINSFQKVPSHYCRASSSQHYLESGLSLKKMFEMYQEKCRKFNRVSLKFNMYRKVFKEEFNLAFHVPKKDRCDLCEEEKGMSESNSITEELKLKYERHQEDKILTKSERDRDRAKSNDTSAVICFDLEKVLLLPRANVSNFFYKRKLSTYNLTAHCSLDKTVYNAIWTEAMAGRGGNEVASALTNILRQVSEKHPQVVCYTLWSDSCVPQNKNSIMCFALKRFMIDHQNIKEIIQKFCCPGHSSIQEVDNAHSHIEKALKNAEVFSPVSLVRVLKTVRPKFFKILQMHSHNFHDYQKDILGLKFQDIPFTKVKTMRYTSNKPFRVEYKTSFSKSTYTEAWISKRMTRKGPCLTLPRPVHLNKTLIISLEKKRDLTSMLKFMSETDRQYYKAMKLIVTDNNIYSDRHEPPRKRVRHQ